LLGHLFRVGRRGVGVLCELLRPDLATPHDIPSHSQHRSWLRAQCLGLQVSNRCSGMTAEHRNSAYVAILSSYALEHLSVPGVRSFVILR
jgi:hypothetical protein